MKKIFIFLLLMAGMMSSLIAQSESDFYIQESGHIDTVPGCTLEDASLAAAEFHAKNANSARENGFTLRVIKEKTRLEEQLVSRARRELPNSPSKGSFWLVNMARASPSKWELYSILFFVNQDGQVYHWMTYSRN